MFKQRLLWVVVRILYHPLDRIRLLYLLARATPSSVVPASRRLSASLTFWGAYQLIVRREGFAGLYRGLLLVAARQILADVLQHYSRQLFRRRMEWIRSLLVDIILHPFDVVVGKVWGDISDGSSRSDSGTLQLLLLGGAPAVVRRVFQTSGVAGFFVGLLPHLSAQVTYRNLAFFFVSMAPRHSTGRLWVPLFLSQIATFIGHPMDAGRRMMVQYPEYFESTQHWLITSYAERGISAWWAGYTLMLLRVVLATYSQRALAAIL